MKSVRLFKILFMVPWHLASSKAVVQNQSNSASLLIYINWSQKNFVVLTAGSYQELLGVPVPALNPRILGSVSSDMARSLARELRLVRPGFERVCISRRPAEIITLPKESSNILGVFLIRVLKPEETCTDTHIWR